MQRLHRSLSSKMENYVRNKFLRTRKRSKRSLRLCDLPTYNDRRQPSGKRIEIYRVIPNICLCFIVLLAMPQRSAAMDQTLVSLPFSVQPSFGPTIVTSSSSPSTSAPTYEPTVTSFPSSSPSSSFEPTALPSHFPTPEPTFEVSIVSGAMFRQRLFVGNGREFLPSEITFIESIYTAATKDAFGETVETKVKTICNVTAQAGGPLPEENARYRMLRRVLQEFEYVDVEYEMTYRSDYINVTDYPVLFQQHINQNGEIIVGKMQTLGLDVTQAEPAARFVIKPKPTVAPGPASSAIPSALPSIFIIPTISPSSSPTLSPSITPTAIASAFPTALEENGPTTERIVIVVSGIVAGAIVFIGLLIYYRKRTFERGQNFQADAAGRSTEGIWNPATRQKAFFVPTNSPGQALKINSKLPPTRSPDGMISPSESLISNQSLLSAGNSIGGDSGDEADATHGLADEFDQYKDQNLEKMRADIEGNLTGFDSMMSQALTRALIDEDDDNIDPKELLWGGSGKLTGTEIEASALGEVADWMKRKEKATIEEKRGFMQDTLNKMVTSVRQGVLGPDDASRTIHECAALLGLQLATEIPVTTLIVTGMRKTVSAEDMLDAFGEFGQISEAAVAPNKRDFGILRFKTNQSVRLAMEKLRVGEIVVQDVAVHVRVLRPDSLGINSIESETKNEDLNTNQ